MWPSPQKWRWALANLATVGSTSVMCVAVAARAAVAIPADNACSSTADNAGDVDLQGGGEV